MGDSWVREWGVRCCGVCTTALCLSTACDMHALPAHLAPACRTPRPLRRAPRRPSGWGGPRAGARSERCALRAAAAPVAGSGRVLQAAAGGGVREWACDGHQASHSARQPIPSHSSHHNHTGSRQEERNGGAEGGARAQGARRRGAVSSGWGARGAVLVGCSQGVAAAAALCGALTPALTLPMAACLPLLPCTARASETRARRARRRRRSGGASAARRMACSQVGGPGLASPRWLLPTHCRACPPASRSDAGPLSTASRSAIHPHK